MYGPFKAQISMPLDAIMAKTLPQDVSQIQNQTKIYEYQLILRLKIAIYK